MIEEILGEARRQKRSIVGLCEHFGSPTTRAKLHNRTISHTPQKIGDDEIIFVPSEEANPQHSTPM